MSEDAASNAGVGRETADSFVDAADWFPPHRGAIPIYDGHPPNTVLPVTKCPHCGELAPTAYDLFRWERQRQRLIDERTAYDRDSEMWMELAEDIQLLGGRVAEAKFALPTGWRQWADREVIPDGY